MSDSFTKHYRNVPEFMEMIMDSWVALNPDEAVAVWHPEDAWWQVEPFATGFLAGYSAAMRNDLDSSE
jgi:hypothetical protein